MDKKTEAFAGKIIGELRNINHALHALLRRPGKQDKKTITTQDHPDNKDERTDGDSPIVSETNPSPCHADKSYDRWYHPCHWWGVARSWNWKQIKSGIEVVGIFFVMGYAVVTYFQWRDLRHNFEVDQRAWIVIKATKFEFGKVSNGIVLAADVIINNTGKTLARDLSGDIVVEMLKDDQSPIFSYDVPHARFAQGVLFPNDPSTSEIAAATKDMEGKTIPKLFAQTEVDEMNAGNSYSVVYAKVDYADRTGTKHWTHFCYFGTPRHGTAMAAMACIKYNDVDNN